MVGGDGEDGMEYGVWLYTLHGRGEYLIQVYMEVLFFLVVNTSIFQFVKGGFWIGFKKGGSGGDIGFVNQLLP